MAVVEAPPAEAASSAGPPRPKKAAAASKRATAAASGKRAALRFGDAEGAVAAPARGGGPQTAAARKAAAAAAKQASAAAAAETSGLLEDAWALAVSSTRASGGPSQPEFALSDLELLTTSECAYLDPASAVFRRAFLYHSSSSGVSGGGGGGFHVATPRAITALFVVTETSTASAEAYFSAAAAALRESTGRSQLTDLEVQQLRYDAAEGVQGLKTPITVAAHFFVAAAGAGPIPRGGTAAARAAATAAANAAAPRPALTATWQRICIDAASLHPDCAPTLSYQALGRQEDVWREVSLLLYAETPEASPRNPPLVLVTGAGAAALPPAALTRLVPATAKVPVVAMDDDMPPGDAAFVGLRWTTVVAAHAMWVLALRTRGRASVARLTPPSLSFAGPPSAAPSRGGTAAARCRATARSP